MEKAPMTLEGYNSLEAELKRLKTTERPDVIKAIAAAREHGRVGRRPRPALPSRSISAIAASCLWTGI